MTESVRALFCTMYYEGGKHEDYTDGNQCEYIHSNLAVYSLKAYAKKYAEHIFLAEYTINQQLDEILMDIYKKKPDVLLFLLLYLEYIVCGDII